jgi:hypothetical protein
MMECDMAFFKGGGERAAAPPPAAYGFQTLRPHRELRHRVGNAESRTMSGAIDAIIP